MSEVTKREVTKREKMLNKQVRRMLDVLEHDILPLTKDGVAGGNKIFGAAIINRHTLELVVAGTNSETQNPLLHGEVTTLNAYWAMDDRPEPKDCLFLSTHEPCSLCLSAITWSGFDNFFYLFTYEDSRDAFGIPHDLKVMGEVFGLPDGEYQRTNEFWTAYALTEAARCLPESERTDFHERIDRLKIAYNELSAGYQFAKGDAGIPLD